MAVTPDDPAFTDRRFHVLLAAKTPGKVWRRRGEDYLLTSAGTIETVTGVTRWLQDSQLLKEGPARALGGRMLVPTADGGTLLRQRLHLMEEKK